MASPGEITRELIQEILKETQKDNSIIVLASMKVEALCEVQNFGSVVSRVTISYTKGEDQSHLTLSLIVKFKPKISNFSVISLFVREIHMYGEVLPRISAFLNKKMPCRHTEFFPQVYLTRASPNYIVALEDIAMKGFKAPSRKNGLDLEQCLLAFRALARFHAASVMVLLEDARGTIYEPLDEHPFREESLKDVVRITSEKMVVVMSEVVDSWLEYGHSWANRMRKRAQTLHEDLMNIWKRDDSALNVLNHGDFGCHNVMYHCPESSGEPAAIMLVDFQCCCYNSPVLDLHQFIFTNANDEVNANHIDTLLREYHNEFTAVLKAAGAPPEYLISLEELLQEFDRKMLYGLYYAVCVLPLFNIRADSNLSAGDMYMLGTSDIDKFKSQLSDAYINSLKGLLPIFNQKNVI